MNFSCFGFHKIFPLFFVYAYVVFEGGAGNQNDDWWGLRIRKFSMTATEMLNTNILCDDYYHHHHNHNDDANHNDVIHDDTNGWL